MSRKDEIIGAVDAIRGLLSLIEQQAEPPHMKGYEFERQFSLMCEERGIYVSRGDRQHVDRVANGLRVQCKNVTPDERGVVYIQPGQRTHYEVTDFDVLAMLAGGNVYLVPMEFLPKTNGHVSIQVSVHGLCRWRDAWCVFVGSNPPDKQKTLFSGVLE